MKSIIYFSVTTFLLLFFSCEKEKTETNENIQIKTLKKGTSEYNSAIDKIFKFIGDKGFIDEDLAKKEGFSKTQIDSFKKEVLEGNQLIQQEQAKGAKIGLIEINNVKEPTQKKTDEQGGIAGTIATKNNLPKSVIFYNYGWSKCIFRPRSNMSTFPVYTLTTTVSNQTERVVRMVPNIGVTVGVDVPYKTKSGQAKISFATSDKTGGSTKYSNSY